MAPKRFLYLQSVCNRHADHGACHGGPTTLDQNIEALFHGQADIEFDQSETQRKDIVASAHTEKVSYGFLEIDERMRE